MEQTVGRFENFLPGSHLILGEAGSGKTRLIWSILQKKDFVEDGSINIVLTDSEKRIWSHPVRNPVISVNAYDTNLSWVSEPSKPGIYYCACDYAPRVITFLECLATWAVQNEKNLEQKVRIFVDFPGKYWSIPEFAEQLNRLYYIASCQDAAENLSIEIWVVGCLPKSSLLLQSFIQTGHIVLLNPFPESWSANLGVLLKQKNLDRTGLLEEIDHNLKDGYYYIPGGEKNLYINPQPVEKP